MNLNPKTWFDNPANKALLELRQDLAGLPPRIEGLHSKIAGVEVAVNARIDTVAKKLADAIASASQADLRAIEAKTQAVTDELREDLAGIEKDIPGLVETLRVADERHKALQASQTDLVRAVGELGGACLSAIGGLSKRLEALEKLPGADRELAGLKVSLANSFIEADRLGLKRHDVVKAAVDALGEQAAATAAVSAAGLKSLTDAVAALGGRLKALEDLGGEKPVAYDLQLRMADNKAVDIRLHGDKGNPWGASDGRPPFKIEQRMLKPSEAAKIKAGLR